MLPKERAPGVLRALSDVISFLRNEISDPVEQIGLVSRLDELQFFMSEATTHSSDGKDLSKALERALASYDRLLEDYPNLRTSVLKFDRSKHIEMLERFRSSLKQTRTRLSQKSSIEQIDLLILSADNLLASFSKGELSLDEFENGTYKIMLAFRSQFIDGQA